MIVAIHLESTAYRLQIVPNKVELVLLRLINFIEN